MTVNLTEQDAMQRKLALDPARSFIVQAPAGSGKTSLLIQRFLTLLIHVNAPEEILAITFTKKAANEMRTRIIQALHQAQYLPEPELDYAKQTYQLAKKVLQRNHELQWHLIENPNQLRIQTIDSLCAYLAKQFPLQSTIGMQLDIATTPTLLYHEAINEVLAHVEDNLPWSKEIASLLLHLDNDLNRLHDLLLHLLAKRDQWLPYIHLDDNAKVIRQQLENHLTQIINYKLNYLSKLIPEHTIDELCALARYAADNLLDKNPNSPIIACRNMMNLPTSIVSELSSWLGIAALLLTEDNQWRKQLTVTCGFPPDKNSNFKSRGLQLIDQFQHLEQLRQSLAEVRNLPKSAYDDKQWQVLTSLLTVLKVSAAQLKITFQQHRQIDFIENAQSALMALGTDEHPTDLTLALDYQIKHLLVDEFQDTSYSQFQLLEKLVLGWLPDDGHSLFVVGDPMQSIYRFREAEVGLFLRMRTQGIGTIKLTPLTLAVNFRSTSTLVEWNNQHFKQIFPTTDDMVTGAIHYSPSISSNTRSPDELATNIVGFASDDQYLQAQHVVKLVQHAKKINPEGSIAILVRARSHLTEIITTLKKADISYRAIDIDPLAEWPCIQDLLSLTNALMHPADRIAWLAILRAPWCGLSLADLLIIAGSSAYTSIYEQMQRADVISKLSSFGQQRIKTILPILISAIADRYRVNYRAWIENTWLALGGPACLQDEAEIDDVQAYFQLLTDMEKLPEPLDLQNFKIKIEKLFAASPQNDATVQIMTIHSAKGLEFDTVILPHLERKQPVDDRSLLLWMDYPLPQGDVALLLAPIHETGNDNDPIYDFIYRQQKIKSDYETDRLLYVAATRAKQHLHLLFNTHLKQNGKYAIESSSFLKKIWPYINPESILATNPEAAIPKHETSKQRYLRRLAINWVNPVSTLTNKSTTAHFKSKGFNWNDNVPKLIGTVTHALLQKFTEQGLAWWIKLSLPEQTSYLSQALIQSGLALDKIDAATQTTHNMLNASINDPKGRWILEPHQDAKSEFAISAYIDNELHNLVIDRTFIDKDGIRWIIDYKTGTPEDSEEKYLEKMQLYAKAMSALDDKPIRLALYFPAVTMWKEL